MTNVHSLHNDAVIFDQASVWVAKMDKGLTSAEKTEFIVWLAKNDRHQQLIIDMTQMWDKMDSLENLADLFPAVAKIKAKPAYRKKPWSLALAASFFLVAFLTLFTDVNLNSLWATEEQLVRYETAVGERSTIYLPDNSKVRLNTNSVVLVRYTDDYRVLTLERGELHVEVAHDKSRPLSVIVNHQVIQAVGTAFSVQVNASDVELIVTDGKVKIAQFDNDVTFDESVLALPSNALAVSKGEMALLAKTTSIASIDTTSINKNLSWQQGHLVFTGETLAEAMAEVSRYTSITFDIADEELKEIKIAGRFKTGDVNGLLAILNHNFNIKTDRVNKGLVVLRKKS